MIVRAVTIRQIGILHIACKMFTIYCCIAIHRCGPVTGRASIRSASLKTTRRLTP